MIIRNGILIDADNNRTYKSDIVVRDGKIKQIIDKDDPLSVLFGYPYIEDEQYDTNVINADGMYVAPGLVDTHVHFRDPGFTHKEDIISGAEAAKAGGYTSVVMMANTKPPVDNTDTLKYVLDKGAETGIRAYSCANVTEGMEGHALTDMDALKDMGAVGFTDDGIPLMDEDIVLSAMKKCVELEVPISFHEEDKTLIKNNGVNHGKASEHYGIYGSPREAEISLIKRDIALAEKTGVRFVIQHISSKEGVELVRQAKKDGLDIHAEATPHHFSLTEEAVIRCGSMAKMNPPLRTEEDRLAIVEGLKDGTIDIIATDHAPHSNEEKNVGILDAPSGIIGLETALSLAIKNLINKGVLTYPELIMRMSLAPCRLYGLSGGEISVGKAADIVIFDDKEEREITGFKSKSENSPFIGETLPGTVHYTICKGEIVYRK